MTVLGLIALTVCSVVNAGYALNDLFIYLPVTIYLRNPGIHQADALVQHLLRMPYPLYHVFAVFYDQRALFALWVVLRAGTIVALHAVCHTVLKDRLAVALAMTLIVLSPGTFGTLGLTQLLLSEPVQYTVAVPVCLAALALWLRRRRIVGLSVAGIAFDLQPMLGGSLIALLGADLIVNHLVGRRPRRLRDAGLPLAAGAAAALPGLAMGLAGAGSDMGTSVAEFTAMVRFGAYFHVLPTTFPVADYLGAATVIGFACLGLRERSLTTWRRTFITWLGVIAVICVVGTVFSEIIPSPFVMKAMPFRATLFLKVIGLICSAAYIRHRVGIGTPVDWGMAFLAVTGMALHAGFALEGLGLAIAAEVVRHARGNTNTGPRATGPGMTGGRFAARMLACTPGAVVLVLGLSMSGPRINIPGQGTPGALENLSTWARENTPADATFITPPDAAMAGFKVLAERSTLGDTKLAGQALFDPTFGRILYARLADMGCDTLNSRWCEGNTFASLAADQLMTLGHRYSACYAIRRAGTEVVLPEAYSNAEFRVYDLCAVQAAQ